MVKLATNSGKSCHCQEASKIQKETKGTFLYPFCLHFFENMALDIAAPINKWFAPSCSSCDSASNDILMNKKKAAQKKQAKANIE